MSHNGTCVIQLSISPLLLPPIAKHILTFSSDTPYITLHSAIALLLPSPQPQITIHHLNQPLPRLSTENSAVSGPNSITLFTLNLFPSAVLHITPINHTPTDQDDKVEALKSDHWGTQQEVLYKPGNGTISNELSSLKPSEVFATVTSESRFGVKIEELKVPEKALQKEEKAKEEKRRGVVSKRIEIIKAVQLKGAKKKPVLGKVREMLIKSGAKGDKSIRQEDRVFFEVQWLDDYDYPEPSVESVTGGEGEGGGGGGGGEDNIYSLFGGSVSNVVEPPTYMFFSRVITSGRLGDIVSKEKLMKSKSNNVGKTQGTIEVLVEANTNANSDKANTESEGGGGYERLPNISYLNELFDCRVLVNFQRIVVRRVREGVVGSFVVVLEKGREW